MKSWVEISGARLVGNLRAVQAVAAAGAGSDVEVLAVVKANGYGHGAALVAPVLVAGGARWLGVSDLDEGVRVRQALGPDLDPGSSHTRIVVMCGMDLEDAPALLAHNLTPVVWTVEHVAAMNRAGQAAGKRAQVHLEMDTGMARQGVAPGPDLAATLAELQASPWVSCEGIMSHLAAAEVRAAGEPQAGEGAQFEAAAALTARQRARFSAALDQVAAAGVRPALVHLGNSSAVDEGSTLGWIGEAARRLGARPMVRPGYALYGHCLPVEAAGSATEAVSGTAGREGQLAAHLQPVLVWKTRITGLREIGAGDTVGYGATFTAAAPMRLALLPVGYADGFRRAASSGSGRDWVRGWVRIAGQRAPVVGRVSMNLTTVDVTAIPEAVLGSEVILLGPGVSAEDHAHWSGTIGYDILCGIRARFELVD